MTFIAWLFEKTPDEYGDAPRPAGVDIHVLTSADVEEDTSELDNIPLEPVFTIIDYTDSAGNETRRRITMRTLCRTANGAMLRAVCHERNALRSFRCDRIGCFIEPDGEVIDTDAFFRDIMGIDLDDFAPSIPPKVSDRAQRLRDFMRPSLSILIALARSDDEFHANELAAICAFAKAEAQALHSAGKLDFDATPHDLSVLANLIQRMRPTREALPGYLRKTLDWDDDRYQRFAEAVEAVVAADGVEMIAETDLINELVALRQQEAHGLW